MKFAAAETQAPKALQFPTDRGAATRPVIAKLDAKLKSTSRAMPSVDVATPIAGAATSSPEADIQQVSNQSVEVATFTAAIPATSASVTNTSAIRLEAESPLPLTTSLPRSPVVVGGVTLRQVEVQNSKALQLALRGALFSARTEYQTALEMTAAAVDAQSAVRTKALQAAGVALVEAEDFVPRSSKLGAEPNVALVVQSHRSGILTEAQAKSLTAASAHRIYLEFARRQLVAATRGAACGSVALHGLGKVLAAVALQNSDAIADARCKAEIYYQAALDVDPQNFPAANDLSVLLAEDGRLEQARNVLQAGIRVSPQPAMWNNLATIHARLGEHQLAAAARWEAQARSNTSSAAGSGVVPTHDVRWVDTATFAAAARPDTAIRNGAPTAAAASAPLPVATPPHPPVQTVQQPRRASLVN